MRFHINQDFAAGIMFAAWGVAGLWLGRHYPIGTSLRMGPGYMPWMLCWLLILFGAVIAGKGMLTEGEKLTRWNFRPLLLVCAGVMAFALLIENAGLPAAIVATVLIGAYGGQEFRLVEVIFLAIGLAIGAIAIFIWGLGLPMPIFPR
jgi:hypothetical protein